MTVGINIALTGQWRKAANILRVAPLRLRVAIDRAVLQEAEFFRAEVVKGFRDQAPGGKKFKPLSPFTIAMRKYNRFGGTKALMVRGDLRNSIKVTKETTPLGTEAFVGVHRTARNKDGNSLVNIAEVHEFGSRVILIEVTEKMRKFLMMVFTKEGLIDGTQEGNGSLSSGLLMIQIPARPFLRPVIDLHFTGLKAKTRFYARVAQNLGGIFGLSGFVG